MFISESLKSPSSSNKGLSLLRLPFPFPLPREAAVGFALRVVGFFFALEALDAGLDLADRRFATTGSFKWCVKNVRVLDWPYALAGVRFVFHGALEN